MVQQEDDVCKVLDGVEIASILNTFHHLPVTTVRFLKMTEQPRKPSAQK